MQGWKRMAVALAAAAAVAVAAGAHAASAGVIEICKSATNGMAGKPFTYAVSGGSSITVLGGRCTGPITVTGSSVTVTEGASNPATEVAAVLVRPSIRKQGVDLAGRSVTVTPGASTSTETLVTFVNEPAGGSRALLKLCAASATGAYLGQQFSFALAGLPLVSVEANYLYSDLADWSCRLVAELPIGTRLTIQAQLPPGTKVNWVDSIPWQTFLYVDSAGVPWFEIQPGTNTVVYDLEPIATSGTGTLQVCKDRAYVGGGLDEGVQGMFAFTVTDAAGATYDVEALAGQCSRPLTVAAGLVQVRELASATSVTGVFTIPGNRLLAANLVNRTASVEVSASPDPADETQVHFVNQAQRGQFKICKALGASSASLAGTTYWFDWRASNGANGSLPITAALSTQCRIVGDFPTGTEVTVSERNPGAFVDSQGVGTVRIGSGVSTLTVTNTASGVLEICKARIDGVTAQPTFRFRIDASTSTVSVQAGKCSLPLRVAIGTHTVTELPDDRYELDTSRRDEGIAVLPADRLVARNAALRTVTVTVPYGVEGETLVTFYNRLKAGLIKICKQIPVTSLDALGAKTFTYLVGTQTHVGPIRPGECVLVPGTFPVSTASGQPATFSVHEDGTPSPTWKVTSISVTGSRGVVVVDLANGNVTFNIGPGVNVVTYTNTAKDP